MSALNMAKAAIFIYKCHWIPIWNRPYRCHWHAFCYALDSSLDSIDVNYSCRVRPGRLMSLSLPSGQLLANFGGGEGVRGFRRCFCGDPCCKVCWSKIWTRFQSCLPKRNTKQVEEGHPTKLEGFTLILKFFFLAKRFVLVPPTFKLFFCSGIKLSTKIPFSLAWCSLQHDTNTLTILNDKQQL